MLKPKILLAAMSTAILAAPALAQTMDHSAHSAHSGGAMAGYMAAMDAMMETMADTPATGNADADFLLMMIPHHQSAIDMARVELDEGEDPETREMAEKIIAAQEQEIADMKAMLQRLGVEAPE